MGEPESESEPESEAEPRDEDEQAQCFSALVLNRGVSDSDCAHCVGGRTYWPCNEEILCVCPSQCVFDGHWRCSPSLGQVKTVGHLRKVRTHGMMTSGNAFIQEANTVTLQCRGRIMIFAYGLTFCVWGMIALNEAQVFPSTWRTHCVALSF